MKALICSALCFRKTENDRFGPISGGVFFWAKYCVFKGKTEVNRGEVVELDEPD
jgi:hypothetical protein